MKQRTWLRVPVLVVALGLAASAQFGGLGGFGSAGAGNPMATTTPQVEFRPWLTANGTWYENQVGALSASGLGTSRYGWNAGGGVSGGKSWERTTVAGGYTGTYMKSSGRANSLANGLNQVGMLSISHRMNQQHGVSIAQYGGSSIGGFGYGAPYGGFGGFGMGSVGALRDIDSGGIGGFGDPAQNGLVDNEIFGSRVNFYGADAKYVYQPNLRWSYGVSGKAGLVRRSQKTLTDLNHYGAGVRASYRVDERSSVSALYQYSQFNYVGLFGGNHVQSAGLQYSHSFNERTQFQMEAGAFYYSSTFLGTVKIDPALAALIGTTSSLTIQNKVKVGWVGGALLSHNFSKLHASAHYDHGITPGNGTILASERDMATGSVGTSVKRVNFSTYGSYYRMTGLLQTGAKTQTFTVGVSGGLRVIGDLHLTANYGAARYLFASPMKQWQKYATAGLTWSPGGAAFRY